MSFLLDFYEFAKNIILYRHELWPKLSFAESNSEILQMLEEIFLKKDA